MGIKEVFGKVYDGVKEAVTGFTDTAKLEYKKGQLNNELSELYETLGKVRFSEMLEGGTPTEESARLCEEIARVKAELTELEAEDTKEQKENCCTVCGKKIPKNISYCPYCGSETKDKEI